MTENKILTLIGEFVSTEIDEVNRVEYEGSNLIIMMENGERFVVEVRG